MRPGRGVGDKDALRSELEASRLAFHALLGSFSRAELQQQSLNPGWTNEEVLWHMAMGFLVLRALLPLARFFGRLPTSWSRPLARVLDRCTTPFNWINALGTRLGGRVWTPTSLGKTIDVVHGRLVKALDALSEREWQRGGMYAPTRWDPISFDDYMTLEDLFRMPLRHFAFHLTQLARDDGT